MAKNTRNFDYKDFSYDDFAYKDYVESDAVKKAQDALGVTQNAKPGTYQSQWQTELDDTIKKILNREKFSYDVNGDALYQQYKDNYIRQGQLAMQDTMGQAAAMTGGYGNSYAASAGNQAYQGYLAKLNDVVPELYGMAYDRYAQEGQDLYDQYVLLGERENADYAKYMDDLNAWQTERDYLTGRYDAERDYDYGKYVDDRNYQYGAYVDDRNFSYGQYADDKNLAYDEHRNAIADEKWQTEFEESQRQYNESLAEEKRQYDSEFAEAQKQYQEALAYEKYLNTLEEERWQSEHEEAKRQFDESLAEEKRQYDLAYGNSEQNETEEPMEFEEPEDVPQDGTQTELEVPEENTVDYNTIVDDCNDYIASGASTSEIASYIGSAFKSGYITKSEFEKLQEIYVKSGTKSSGGRYTY